MTGSVSGSVADDLGRPVSGALVSLTPLGGGDVLELRTSGAGTFEWARLFPGNYEIRIEEIGYRPLVARGLTVVGGEERTVAFTLTVAEGPVLTVDTIALAGSSAALTRRGGLQLGDRQINGLPHRLADLASVASLSTVFDESLGGLGLPGDATLIIADGVPVYRAPHPTARSELSPHALFPMATVAGISVLHNPSEIEWAGGAGAYVDVVTGSPNPTRGFELDAAYSGGPGWSSSEHDFSRPTLHSFEGSIGNATGVGGGATRLTVVGDVLRHQTPLAPRASDALGEELTGIDPVIASSLSAPSVETYARYSALARLDLIRGSASSGYLRGAATYLQRDLDGADPVSMGREAAVAEESFDFSVAGGILAETSPEVTAELRGGISGSYRDFLSGAAEAPPAHLTELATSLGGLPSARGESSRTDLVLTPILHYTPGVGRFKVGGTLRASSHFMDHSRSSAGDFVFADAQAVNTSVGFGETTAAGDASFSTQEFGVFAQYSATIAPGLQLSLAGRYDHERVPTDEVALNRDWRSASGLSNADTVDSFDQFGARASITWEPPASPGTRVTLLWSMQEGDLDPRALYELLAQDIEGSSKRFSGAGVGWPSGGIPALSASDLPALTLLGPDTRPPRTIAFSAGIARRVGDGVSLHVGGTLRRTDFLMRRRNLNLPVVARSADPHGRPVYGTLAKDGGLVTATGDDARRFSGFGEVWALDPDGWSEYRGITAGFEHAGRSVEIFGAYTYSETTDNWVGAASGLVDASLAPRLPDGSADEWAEGISDFDVPHRVAAGASVRAGSAELSGVYHYRSGLPFTPGYRYGVDANGDGSMRNDVAFVPSAAELAPLLDSWPCLEDQAGSFAARNSCRGPDRHAVDARLEIALGQVGGRVARIRLEGLNLVEHSGGVRDEALLLVDPAAPIATSADGTVVTIPTGVNPEFGRVVYPSSRGRMLRIGVRVGG